MKLLLEITIKSKIEMQKFGTTLAKLFSLNDLITFDGDLGVGKTFICKSIINNLTTINEVVSPTFNIVQTYPLQKDEEIWHCDFYRINNFEEVEEIGVFEDFKKKIILLEWPKFELELNQFNPLSVDIAILENNHSNLSERRKISLTGSKKWDNKIKKLHNHLAL